MQSLYPSAEAAACASARGASHAGLAVPRAARTPAGIRANSEKPDNSVKAPLVCGAPGSFCLHCSRAQHDVMMHHQTYECVNIHMPAWVYGRGRACQACPHVCFAHRNQLVR